MILVNLCGHGHFDMSAYDAFLNGELTDLEFSRAGDGSGARAAAGGARSGLSADRRASAAAALSSSRPGQVTEWLKVRDWKSCGR